MLSLVSFPVCKKRRCGEFRDSMALLITQALQIHVDTDCHYVEFAKTTLRITQSISNISELILLPCCLKWIRTYFSIVLGMLCIQKPSLVYIITNKYMWAYVHIHIIFPYESYLSSKVKSLAYNTELHILICILHAKTKFEWLFVSRNIFIAFPWQMSYTAAVSSILFVTHIGSGSIRTNLLEWLSQQYPLTWTYK